MHSPRRRLGAAGVLIVAALALSPARASAAPLTTPRLGSHAMIDTSMSPQTVDGLFRATRRAHLGSIRFDVLAAWLFPNSADAPEWQTLDLYRAGVRRYRLDGVAVLSGTPLWLARCPPGAKDFFRCPPSDYAAWGRLVQQIAARAPEIRYWEVWNEANLPNTYFYGSAVEYARLLTVTSAAIRRGNPKAKVVFTGMLAPYDQWLDTVMRQPGVRGSFDIANAHFRGGVDKLDDMVRVARGQFHYYGFDGPLWVTEMGYTSDPKWQWIPGYLSRSPAAGQRTQARYLRRAIPQLLRAGAARVFLTLRDLDTEWGIFTSEGLLNWPVAAPKPAYRVVRRIARCLATGASPTRRALAGCVRVRAHRRRAPAPRRGSARPASSASASSR
jgi:hypothetical protein